LDILQDPTRILNADKTGFQFLSKAGKVLAFKGDKNMYEDGRGVAIASIRAVLALSVSGIMRPPMLVIQRKECHLKSYRVPERWRVRLFPAEWMTSKSSTNILKCFQSTSWKI
jgi:hypothetical protein